MSTFAIQNRFKALAKHLEELGFATTPIGEISLRRRYEPRIAADVFEIKLGDEFLMSSLIADSEIALATLAVAACHNTAPLDVAIGGLGLGYTARAALDESRVGSVLVIDYLQTVIDWHKSGLLPLGPSLTGDPRCRFIQGDFFALTASPGLDATDPRRRFDIVLVDIDHSPDALLDARSTSFYTEAGLGNAARHLKPGGIFALWSDAAPDSAITARLATAFTEAWAEPISLDIPGRTAPFTQTVYLARAASASV